MWSTAGLDGWARTDAPSSSPQMTRAGGRFTSGLGLWWALVVLIVMVIVVVVVALA